MNANRPRGRFSLQGLMIAIAAIGLVCAFLGWLGRSMIDAREQAIDMTQCGRMHKIRQALLEYEFAHGAFPPVYTVDEFGMPSTSWRVLILPFMEESGLLQQYDQSQPWDSPTNAPLIAQIPDCYEPRYGNQANAEGLTPFVAVTGNGTLFDSPATIDDHWNSSRKHEAIVICNNRRMVPWTKPDDCSLKEFQAILKSLKEPDSSLWVFCLDQIEIAKPIHGELADPT